MIGRHGTVCLIRLGLQEVSFEKSLKIKGAPDGQRNTFADVFGSSDQVFLKINIPNLYSTFIIYTYVQKCFTQIHVTTFTDTKTNIKNNLQMEQ